MTRCVRRGMGTSPGVRHKQPTPELTSPPPGTPPLYPGDNNGALNSQIANLPARYAYKHPTLPSVQLFKDNAYAKYSEHDEDLIPDLRTDEGTSTG